MNHFRKGMAVFAIAAITFAASCTESNTVSAEEQTRINKMDSTSSQIKENREKLENQTKKVEESLEKLDKEFDSTTKN
jgi:peptidoglycan hydrolase CwlO-like protein